jgi:hypothetical protein
VKQILSGPELALAEGFFELAEKPSDFIECGEFMY